MGTNVVSMLGFVVFAGMVSGMGTTIFAAHSIAVTAEELFYISGYGLRMSTSALVGAAVGEGNQRKFSIYCRLSVSLTVGMMILSGLLLYVCAVPLMGLFTTSSPVRDMGGEHVGSADTVYLPCRACLASGSPGGMVLHDRVQCLQSGAPESAVYDRAV